MIYTLVSNREKRNDDFINPRLILQQDDPRGRGLDSAPIYKVFSLFFLSRREIWIRASSEKCIRYRRFIKLRIFSKFNPRRKSIFDDIFRLISYRFDDVKIVEYFRRFCKKRFDVRRKSYERNASFYSKSVIIYVLVSNRRSVIV